jgi:hypothetical protein
MKMVLLQYGSRIDVMPMAKMWYQPGMATLQVLWTTMKYRRFWRNQRCITNDCWLFAYTPGKYKAVNGTILSPLQMRVILSILQQELHRELQ